MIASSGFLDFRKNGPVQKIWTFTKNRYTCESGFSANHCNLYKIDGQALKRIQDLETDKLDMESTDSADKSPMSQTLLQMQMQVSGILNICQANTI